MAIYPLETLTTRFSQGGVNSFQYSIIDGNGYPLGPLANIVAGQARGMGVLPGIKTGGGPSIAPREINFSGDNGYYRTKMLVPAASLPLLDLQFSVFSMDFNAAVTNTKIRAIGQWQANVTESNARFMNRQGCVILNCDIIDADLNNYGLQRYANWVYPAGWIYPMYAPFAEAAPTSWDYKFSPVQASRMPWGDQFSNALDGATRGVRICLVSYYPITLDTFISDGATTVWQTQFTPSSDFTGSGIIFRRNGSPLAGVSSVNRTITMSSTGVSGDINEVLYEAVDLLSV